MLSLPGSSFMNTFGKVNIGYFVFGAFLLIGALLHPLDAMAPDQKVLLKEKVKEMFFHAYDHYLKHAFPADELMPLSCKGRYRGSEPSRGDIDDSLGNYSLTLIDSLDTLFIFNETKKFEEAVRLVIQHVRFDQDIVVSVFEANIRVLGGLIGGHISALVIKRRGEMLWYQNELLHLANDLGVRLLRSFNSSTGIPFPRINLKHGLPPQQDRNGDVDTCTACAGTMILEFATLSRLTGNPEFEQKAKKAMDYLWNQRNRDSNLVGTVINIHTGDWVRRESGVGAGIDSYYEYLFKAYVLLGNEMYLHRFNTHYMAIKKYIENTAPAILPLLVDVMMHRPSSKAKNFMDALHAFWPALQVLMGDLKPAITLHEVLYHVVQRHHFLPEAFTTDFNVHWAHHPLRPEFIESTYFLYRATKDPHYLEVGEQVLQNLEKYARVSCGFAAIKDVRTMAHDDQLDSFVLAETFKYLYLLFAESSDIPISLDDYIFTTEAHILPLNIDSFKKTTQHSEHSSPLLPSSSNKPSSSHVKHSSRKQQNTSKSGGYDGFPENVISLVRGCPNIQWWSVLRYPVDSATRYTTVQIPSLLSQDTFMNMISKKSPTTFSSHYDPSSLSPSARCSSVAHQIRSPLQQFLADRYPQYAATNSKIKFRVVHPRDQKKPRLTPKDLDLSINWQVKYLKSVGIQVTMMGSNRYSLQHLPSTAVNSKLAKEGSEFMHDLILFEENDKEMEKNVHYVFIFNNQLEEPIKLLAMPFKYSPFPKRSTMEESDEKFLENILSDLGVVGELVFYPGINSLACNINEGLTTQEIEKLRGSIVIVRHGICRSAQKALTLYELGAKAGILVDEFGEGTVPEQRNEFSLFGEDVDYIPLPFVYLSSVMTSKLLSYMANSHLTLDVLLTAGDYSLDILKKLYVKEKSASKEETSSLKDVKSNSDSSPSTHSHSVDKEVFSLLVPHSWQLYSMRYLIHQEDDTCHNEEDTTNAVTIYVSRVHSTLQQDSSFPYSKYSSSRRDFGTKPSEFTMKDEDEKPLSWELTIAFNLASKKLHALMSKYQMKPPFHLYKNVRFLRSSLDWIPMALPDIPFPLHRALVYMLREIVNSIDKEAHQLQMFQSPSLEKVLKWLESHLKSQMDMNNKGCCHLVKVHLHCLHGDREWKQPLLNEMNLSTYSLTQASTHVDQTLQEGG